MSRSKRVYINVNHEEGYPAGDNLYYECQICKEILPSKPGLCQSCRCGNIAIDAGYGRLSIKDATAFNVFEKEESVKTDNNLQAGHVKEAGLLATVSGARWWWKPEHLVLSCILFLVWLVIVLSPFLFSFMCAVKYDDYSTSVQDNILYMLQFSIPSILFVVSHNCKKGFGRIIARLITMGTLFMYCGCYGLIIAMAHQDSMGEKLDFNEWDLYVEVLYFLTLLLIMFVPQYWKVGGEHSKGIEAENV